jgi:predicted DCC family thiol-disulfide oxidoreductase YuxK
MFDTLYFDGHCPLCSKEIALLQRWQRGGLVFVDIHSLEDFEGLPTKADLLRVLHLKRGNEWITAADATVAAWSHTYLGILFKVLRLPFIRTLVDRIYLSWAKRRYNKMYCASLTCGDPS